MCARKDYTSATEMAHNAAAKQQPHRTKIHLCSRPMHPRKSRYGLSLDMNTQRQCEACGWRTNRALSMSLEQHCLGKQSDDDDIQDVALLGFAQHEGWLPCQPQLSPASKARPLALTSRACNKHDSTGSKEPPDTQHRTCCKSKTRCGLRGRPHKAQLGSQPTLLRRLESPLLTCKHEYEVNICGTKVAEATAWHKPELVRKSETT